jgi:MBG domain (YGX type)
MLSAIIGARPEYKLGGPGAVNVGSYTIIPCGQTSSNYAINYVSGRLTILPPSIEFVQNVLGTAANATGTTSPSSTMNATVLPTSPASLPGSFGGNTVLPYGNDAGASGNSANQQTSNATSDDQQTSDTSGDRRRRQDRDADR